MLLLCASAALLALPLKTEAAITAGVGTATTDNFSASTQDTSVSVAEGSNAVLFVTVATDNKTVSAITYDGQALTQLWSAIGNGRESAGWILVNPHRGTHTLHVVWTGTPDAAMAWAQPWYGVAQGGTVGKTWRTPVTSNDGSSVEPKATVSGTSAGDVAIDHVQSICNSITAHPSQTVRRQDTNGGCVVWGTSSLLATTTSTIMNWTQANTDVWSMGATALIPAFGTALAKPPNNLGLVGYWSFNEGTGTKATDFSGNGNTGTLQRAGSSHMDKWQTRQGA